MWKRIPSKALRGLIAKLIWQTEKITGSWRFSAADSHSCWPCHDVFPPCCSSLPATLCLTFVRLMSRFLQPFFSDYFSLAEALWWSQELLSPSMPVAGEYLVFFPVLFPSTAASEEYLGSLMYFFPSCLHVPGAWSLEVCKGAGNQKAELSPADLAVLWNQSVSLTSLVFHHFHFLPVHVHVSTLGIQSLCWSSYTFSYLFFLNLNKLLIFYIEKNSFTRHLSPNLCAFSRTTQKFLFQTWAFLLILKQKDISKDITKCL